MARRGTFRPSRESIRRKSWWRSATAASCRTCCASSRKGNTQPSSSDVKRQAGAIGFDLCGIAPAASFPELEFLREWLDLGYAGEMQYLHRSAERRMDVRAVLPSARYAWGDDYHAVIDERLATLVEWLRARAGSDFDARAYVDTGPVQERVYAQYAGIGWIGKNTCLINDELGSWVFLSVIITNLSLEADAPALDQCGTCARCLDACPTGALVEPHVMDATRCLSYLTIELKGPLPETARDDLGHHVYGCDICQDVCPWNLTPSTGVSTDRAWLPRAGLDAPSLLALWQRSDDELRTLLKGSAMKRAGVRRLRRNLAVAVGNSAAPEGAASLEAHDAPTCRDPLVADHTAWAVRKLRG